MQENDRKQEIINRMKYEFSQEMGIGAEIAESIEIEKNN